MTQNRQHLHEALKPQMAATPQEWMWDSVGEGRVMYAHLAGEKTGSKANLDAVHGEIYRTLKESTLSSRTDRGRESGTLTKHVKEQG